MNNLRLRKGLIKDEVFDAKNKLGVTQASYSYIQNTQLSQPLIRVDPEPIVFCDDWVPQPEDMIFKHIKDAIILPVSAYYGVTDDTEFDYFNLNIKQRCYNSDDMRNHCTHYLNYFEKFYDPEHELLSIYFHMKYMIDYEPEAYDGIAFSTDIKKYILSPSMRMKVNRMVKQNFSLDLSYKNDKNPCLQYNNSHAMMMMEISIFMNMVIPLLTHYIKKNQSNLHIKDFLLYVFNIIITQYGDRFDLYAKIYETAITNISKSRDNHSLLWDKQSIRGKSVGTHSEYTVNNIILQIFPKYTFSQNLIHFNYKSVNQNIKFQITGVPYEYTFIPLSNSKRDEDMNSEFDKYEAYQIKANEALYVQNRVNANETMKYIENKWGPFDKDEIMYYRNRIGNSVTGEIRINTFQQELVFGLFYSYFGDPESIKAIDNAESFIKLVIAARRMLELSGLVVLPYIISSKILRLSTRSNINKREMVNVEASPNWPYVQAKYANNEKIIKNILSLIAVMSSSEFEIIDYNDTSNLDGRKIDVHKQYIIEEVLTYALII